MAQAFDFGAAAARAYHNTAVSGVDQRDDNLTGDSIPTNPKDLVSEESTGASR